MLAIYQLKVEVSEIFCEILHVVTDFLVGDSGVDLRGLDICMAEHLAHRFDGYTLADVIVVAKVCLARWNVRFFSMPQMSAISFRFKYMTKI